MGATPTAPVGEARSVAAQLGRRRPRTRPGDAFAIMYIPSLGNDWAKAVVEGVTLDDLRGTIGHYPQLAAARARSATSRWPATGRRTGSRCATSRSSKVGDKVYVETEDTWYVYTVRSTRSSRRPTSR